MPFRKYKALEVNIVSAKAYEALSKSNELTVANEVAQNPKKKNDGDEKERKKRIKGSLIKFGSLAVFAFVVWIFATIAWFSQNDSVSSDGMGIRVGSSPFELKTVGYYGYYDNYLPGDFTKVANNLASAAQPPSGEYSSLSTANGSSIQWLITADSNAKNYVTSSTNEDNKGIRPGTSGEMKFWIVPKDQQTINVKFKLEITPYINNYVLDENGNYTFAEGSDAPIEDTPISIAGNSNYTTVLNYLVSHIMFFKNRTEVTPQSGESYYTYSDLITLDNDFDLVYDSTNHVYTSTLTFSSEESVLQDKELSIYWVWPETLAEAILPEAKQNPGYHAICTGDEILNKLKANPSYFLKGYNAATDTDNTTNANLTKSVIEQYYSRLSVEYNNADQEIGDNIGYIMLTLSAIG